MSAPRTPIVDAARRGQLCIIHTRHTVHFLKGRNQTHDEFAAGTVEGVTREGVITRFRSIATGTVKTLKHMTGVHMKYVMSRLDPNRDEAIAAVKARGSDTFATLEEARIFFKPFRGES